MSLETGSRVSHYTLERRLGSGGMGEVFLAHDHNLDRKVAIKFLRTPGDVQARRRLLREARAVAGLDHPGICAVYEVGTDEVGGDFIVMQHIEGEPLSARLRRGRLGTEQALGIGAKVAEALIAAHRRGIVHRDLKPQNIMVTPGGKPKLLDFGLATYVLDPQVRAEAATSSQITEENAVVGTAGYMAPEQARGEQTDVRSDIFALGGVLYECLTGRRAFTGATSAEILGQVLHVDPPLPSTVAPELDAAHDALCLRLLHKVPAERFQSAEEVLGAIRVLTASTSVDRPTEPRVRAVSWRWSVGALAAAIAAVAVVWWIWRALHTLPVPPAGAVVWYERGGEAMRDATYAGARAAFAEAIRIFPGYVQAHARLAEAYSALDDERSAREELLRVSELLPDASRLAPDERLRFEAARASALREFEKAFEAARRLADLVPGNVAALLDVGRAEEAAGRQRDARATYAKALELDRQYAAAHLRLAVLQGRAGMTDAALASFDESLRLYHTAMKSEGEAEGLLRKASFLSAIGRFDAARDDLIRVLQFAADDPRYAGQRVRAEIELAKVAYSGGDFKDAESRAGQAVSEATAAGLQTLAAAGFLDLGNIFLVARRFDAAEPQYLKALELASGREAKRLEMRVRLQLASLRLQTSKPEEALAMSAEPLKYFAATHEARLENQAKTIASRADEALERYDEARSLAAEVLAFAEASKDDVLTAYSLENLAGQLTSQGHLTDALAHRERIEAIHRRLKDDPSLALDLVNRARLLVRLGRSQDAERVLTDLERGVASGAAAYASRPMSIALVRAHLATTTLRYPDVERAASAYAAAKAARGQTSTAPSDSDLTLEVLVEHARARLGRSRKPIAEIAGWARISTSPVERRELSFWVAQTLLARREPALALSLVTEVLADPITSGNPELGWRFAAVGAQAARSLPAGNSGAGLPARVAQDAARVADDFKDAAAVYFARPDLVALTRKDVR